MTELRASEERARVGALVLPPVALVVASGLVASWLGLRVADAALVSGPAALAVLLPMVLRWPDAGRRLARGALWLVLPSYLSADLAIDPVVSWGAFDPHGPPMELLQQLTRALLAGLALAVVLALVPVGEVPAGPIRARLRQLAPLALLLLASWVWVTDHPQRASVRAVALAGPATLELGDGRLLVASRSDDDPRDAPGRLHLDVRSSLGPLRQPWRLCSARAGELEVVQTAQQISLWWDEAGVLRGCGFERVSGWQTVLRQHARARAGPRATLGALLAVFHAAMAASALLLALQLRRRASTLAEPSPPLLRALAVRIDGLEVLALTSALCAAAIVLVLARF